MCYNGSVQFGRNTDMKAIIYQSKTGFTERYAKALSEKTGIPAYTLKAAKKSVEKGAEIVYLGWVFANKITDFKKAQKRWNIAAVGAVGMNPQCEANTQLIGQANNPQCPLFYLRGGLDASRLKPMQKWTLDMVCKGLEKENKAEYADAVALLKQGGDFYSEENLSALLAFVLLKQA